MALGRNSLPSDCCLPQSSGTIGVRAPARPYFLSEESSAASTSVWMARQISASTSGVAWMRIVMSSNAVGRYPGRWPLVRCGCGSVLMFQAFHAVLERVSGAALGFPLDYALDRSQD